MFQGSAGINFILRCGAWSVTRCEFNEDYSVAATGSVVSDKLPPPLTCIEETSMVYALMFSSSPLKIKG